MSKKKEHVDKNIKSVRKAIFKGAKLKLLSKNNKSIFSSLKKKNMKVKPKPKPIVK